MPNPEIPDDTPINHFNELDLGISPKDARDFIKYEHTTLVSELRVSIAGLQQKLDQTDGFAVFHTWANDEELTVLLTNRREMVTKNHTAVVINQKRFTEPGEPSPDGMALNVTDIVIRNQPPRKQGSVEYSAVKQSAQYREHHKHAWTIPTRGTLLMVSSEKLFGYGNLRTPFPFYSDKTNDPERLIKSCAGLILGIGVLKICAEDSSAFEPDIRDFSDRHPNSD